MKIIFALLGTLISISLTAQTNTRRWEASLAAGGQTYPLSLKRPLLHFYVLGAPEYTDQTFSGSLAYQTNNPRLQLGISATFLTIRQQRGESWNWSGSSDPTYHTISTNHIFALMPGATYSYLLKRNFRLYSKVNAGVAFSTLHSVVAKTSNSTSEFAFQVTPVGCRLGNNLSFFVELGYGYQGLLQAGIAARIPAKNKK